MVKLLLAGVLVACSSPSAPVPQPAPGSAPAPREGQLQRTETPEAGGTRLKLVGTKVPVTVLDLPGGMRVPIGGAVDVEVDLLVPHAGGVADYRGATGTALLRCNAGCTIGDGQPVGVVDAGGSAMPMPALPRMAIDRFEARAVLAGGRAELTRWELASKDLRLEVSGALTLARALADSEAALCVRFARPGVPMTPGSVLGSLMAELGVAVDANGLANLKLTGPIRALAPEGFGCDGATPPAADPPDPAPPTDALARHVTKLSYTAYEVDRALLAKVAADPAALAGQARIVPRIRDGKQHGITVYAVRPGSTLHHLGIANGDSVLSIDGHELTPDTGDAVRAALRAARPGQAIVVKLERRGIAVTMTFTVRR